MNPRTLLPRLCLLVCVLGTALTAGAADVSGTWKWNFERNGETREITMKLEQSGSKLTGAVTGPDGNELAIREGKVAEDGKVAFNLEIERDGSTMKVTFDGKAVGDTITGKTKFINSQGEEREREWVAERDSRKAVGYLSGEWKSSFKLQNGTEMESTLRLKQNGEKLTGNVSRENGNETEIQDGKVQGDEVSFKLVRERDGRGVTSKYRGKMQTDGSIKGQIESDWTGEVRRLEWEAKKAK